MAAPIRGQHDILGRDDLPVKLLLVHGLGRTPLSLTFLGRSLRQAGHEPSFFSYWAFAESYQRIVDRLTLTLLALNADASPVGLIGHSLGGLLLRHALARVPSLRVHRLIMLGTPNQPPRLARRAILWLPFRAFTGSCGALLATADAYGQIPPLRVPYTIIAGTAGSIRPGGSFAGESNDGFVAVSETRVTPQDRPVLFPVFHTFMMNSHRVQQAILAALAQSVAV